MRRQTVKLLRTEEVSGSLFRCAEGCAPPGAAIGSGHHGAVSRACCADRCLWKLLLAFSFRNDLRPSWSTAEAPSAATAPGLSNVFMVELDPSATVVRGMTRLRAFESTCEARRPACRDVEAKVSPTVARRGLDPICAGYRLKDLVLGWSVGQ
jgi:hypothetical protein